MSEITEVEEIISYTWNSMCPN